MRRTRAGLRSEGEKRTMLIGGGQAGAIALREFQTSPRSENKVVCIIDDAPNKVGSYLGGVKIVGGRSAIARMAEKYDIDEIILAIPSGLPAGEAADPQLLPQHVLHPAHTARHLPARQRRGAHRADPRGGH